MDKTEFLESFDYDLWANKRWLEAIPSMPDPETAFSVFDHIIWASETWLSRIVPHDRIQADRSQILQQLSQKWKQVVEDTDLEIILDYKNNSGVPYRRQIGAILRHVINHGTYHRGQLRGMADAQSFKDFPETDLIGYFIQFELHGG